MFLTSSYEHSRCKLLSETFSYRGIGLVVLNLFRMYVFYLSLPEITSGIFVWRDLLSTRLLIGLSGHGVQPNVSNRTWDNRITFIGQQVFYGL